MAVLMPPLSAPKARVLSPTGNRVARIGDSITAMGATIGTNKWASTPQDWLSWADLQMGRRLQFHPVDNFAQVGWTTAQMRATQLGQVLAIANRIDFCTVLGGTNDIGRDNRDPNLVIADLDAIYSALLNANVRPIVLPILPRVSQTTTQQQSVAMVNGWIRERARQTPAIILADAWPTMFSGTNISGMAANLAFDGLHLHVYGAYILGTVVANALRPIVPPTQPLSLDDGDTYNATYNPRGNILANGRMTGTFGSITGGGLMTGTMATSWLGGTTNGTLTSGTITASKVARSDVYGEWQRIALTNAVGSGTTIITVDQSVNGTFAAGDVIEATCEANVASGSTGIQCVALHHREFNPAGAWFYVDMDPVAGRLMTNTPAWRGTLRSPRITVRSGTTGVMFRIQINADLTTSGGCNLTADFGLACIRKVG